MCLCGSLVRKDPENYLWSPQDSLCPAFLTLRAAQVIPAKHRETRIRKSVLHTCWDMEPQTPQFAILPIKAGEMAQRSRTLTALPEDLGPVPSTNMGYYNFLL